MIAEQALRAILQTQTDLIYNLLEREENNKPRPGSCLTKHIF